MILFSWLSKLIIGSLFLCIFAALLIAYLWDYFRLSKRVVLIGTAIYCTLGTWKAKERRRERQDSRPDQEHKVHSWEGS